MSRTSSACASQTNMKSGVSRKKLPTSPAEWEAVIAASPGENRPPIAKEKAAWANAVVVKIGGYQAARTALATKRKHGQRGPQHSPTKQSVRVRSRPEVLVYYKATGAAWQTGMNDALCEWVSKRGARQRNQAS